MTIDLYAAVREMRRISKDGGTFAVKFRKWDRQRQRGGDLCHILHARLRPAASDDDIDAASYKLFITDTDTGEPRTCWQMLVTEFDGMKTVLR